MHPSNAGRVGPFTQSKETVPIFTQVSSLQFTRPSLGNVGFLLHHAHQNKLRCGLAFTIFQEGECRGPEWTCTEPPRPQRTCPLPAAGGAGQGVSPGALSTRCPPQGPLCSPSSPSAQGLCWPLVLLAIPSLLEQPHFPVLAPPSGLSIWLSILCQTTMTKRILKYSEPGEVFGSLGHRKAMFIL